MTNQLDGRPTGADTAFRRHPAADDPHARESIVYMAHDVAAGVTVAAYTWLNAAGEAGCSAAVLRAEGTLKDGRPDVGVPTTFDFDEVDLGPLTLSQGTSDDPARVTWSGAHFSFTLDFSPMHPAYSYADAPHGCPPYVARDRVEQSGLVELTLTIDGETRSSSCTGHRDHSWGVRDWQMMQHYKWIEAQTPQSAVHVFAIESRGRSLLHGYVYREGQVATVTSADIDVALDRDLFGTQTTLRIADALGRDTEVLLRENARIELPVSPEATLVDTAVTADIDGESGGGYVDLLWPPAYLAHVRSRSALTASDVH